MRNRTVHVVAVVTVLALVLGGTAAVASAAPAMQTIDPEQGVVIISVAEGGPAAEAGLVRGDILQEMNGEEIERPADLVPILADLEPGDEVELTVLHGDELRSLEATLTERYGQPYLGLTPSREIGADVMLSVARLGGARITSVVEDSPAEAAGLQEGDVIVAVDGEDLAEADGLREAIGAHEPGDVVTLDVRRIDEDETLEVEVELGESPDDEDVAYLGVEYVALPHVTMMSEDEFPFRRFNMEDMPRFRFDRFDPEQVPEAESLVGLVILSIVEDGPAADAGLQKGDVITAIDGEELADRQELLDLLAAHEPGDEINLTVLGGDGQEEREVEVTLGEHPDDDEQAYLGVTLGTVAFEVAQHAEDSEDMPWWGPLQRFFRWHRSDRHGFQFELPFDLDELGQQLRQRLPGAEQSEA